MTDPTTPPPPAAPKLSEEALVEMLGSQCDRIVNGQCLILGCLRRGGYEGPSDERLGDFETVAALARCKEYDGVQLISALAADNDRLREALADCRNEIFQAVDQSNWPDGPEGDYLRGYHDALEPLSESLAYEKFWWGEPLTEATPAGEYEDLVDDFNQGRCRAALSDGECIWRECPQARDGEPMKTGRSCPLLPDPSP